MASLTARDVADYLIASVDVESGDNISNLKLQKLLYYAQGFSLAIQGEPLFDEQLVAWTHGPVVSALYHTFKQYGAGAIPPPESFDDSKYNNSTKELLDEVLNVYGQFSAWKLRDMTHKEPPWRDTAVNGTISEELMRSYFRTLVDDGQG